MSLAGSDPFSAPPQSWDVVVVGGVTSPGICKLTECVRKHEWDIKKGKGSLGAEITFVQRPPAEVLLEFYLWQADHFAAWDTFVPLFKYDPTRKTVQAVDIYHPSLADIDLTSVVTEEIGAITHEGGGYYRRTVKLLEYFPPPNANATGTPSGSTGTNPNDPNNAGNNPNTTNNAQDAQEQEVQNLWGQYQAA